MKKNIIALFALGCFAQANVWAEDIRVVKIGSGAPTTGVIAHLGLDNEKGAQLAVDDINKKGLTINGQKIQLKLVAVDDESNPRTGIKVAQKLVNADVVAVVGHLNSGISIPSNQIYSAVGMVQISPSSTSPDYTLRSRKTPQGHVSAYRVVAQDRVQGRNIGQWLSQRGAKRVVIFDDATQYGKGLADYVEKELVKRGVVAPMRESLTDKTYDFRLYLAKIKSANPDYIFWGGMDDTAAALVKQIKQLGLSATFVSGDGMCTNQFIELAGRAAEGAYCSQGAETLATMKQGFAFNQRFSETFGNDAIIYAPYAYDAVYAIVEAMKIAGSTEREAIAEAMPKVDFEGVTGQIRFDGKGDIVNGAITMSVVKNRLLEVEKVLR
jgi:branched-chain amino acid transport system substrate-binding protein